MSQIETPTGTADRGPDDAEVAAALETRLMAVWRSRGYRRIEVPTYEDYGLFARLYGGEVRQRLVTFTTDREYALRPDLTAGICRMVAGALDGVPASPMRVASSGRAFRHEWVRPLRQRMFHQMGIERIGDPVGGSGGADLEILSLARLGLVSIGLSGGLLRVGHAGLRRAILEKLVPEGDEQAFGRLSALLDGLSRLRDRLNPPRTGADLRIDPEPGQSARIEPADHPDLRPFLGELRRALRRAAPDLMLEDGESGLRTLEGRLSAEAASLGLSEAQSEALSRLTWSTAGLDELADVLGPLMDDPRAALDTALGHVESCSEDLAPLVLRFSLGASRWDGFYTGFFFEIDAPVLGPDVAQVLGGGRYDGVMEKLGTPAMPACGFALGLERCAAALALLQGSAAVRRRWNQREPVLVCYTPAAAERAALLGERLGASGASVAFHPEPVAGLDPQVVEGLMALPGTPYRHTLHVGEVTLRLLDVGSGSEIPIEEQDLYVLFGTPGAG